MKTLFRILLILLVATLIGGLMYVGVNASGSSNSAAFEEGRPPQFDHGGDNDDSPFRPEGGEFRPEGERGSFGFPGGVIKALVLMTIAGGIYSMIVWAGKKAKKTITS